MVLDAVVCRFDAGSWRADNDATGCDGAGDRAPAGDVIAPGYPRGLKPTARFANDDPRGGGKLSLAERLVMVEQDIAAILTEHGPDVAAVEELYAHYKHPRTAILMGHARGVILLTAAKLGIEVKSFTATEIKRHLTGNGRAPKAQVQRAIQATLGLADLPDPPDVADALAIALRCATEVRQGLIGRQERLSESAR